MVMKATITGVGHYVPPSKLTNQDFERMVDTSDDWITTRTGIKERRILETHKATSEMAVRAAQHLLEQSNTVPGEIELLIVATVTPDQPVPATAAIVQEKLGAHNCWGFDLNGGCTGFICALATGCQFIETGKYRKVMIIGADKMSAVLNYQDRSTCVLFGDGAGAVLLEGNDDETAGIEDFMLGMDGSGADFLKIPAGGSLMPASEDTVARKLHYVYQDGRAVFKRAVNQMAEVSTQILARNRLSGQDVNYLVPHQANIRIIEAVAQKMGLNPEQVIINIHRYGNTTAATIPLAMSETYQAKKLKKGDWIVMSAFGAGFTWGSLLLKWGIE